MQNVVIHIKSVFDKNYNHYFKNVFLEKCSYKQKQKYYIMIELTFLNELMPI